MENFRIFNTRYFDYTIAFQILFDSYWLVTGCTQLATKHNGYFTFDILDAVCMGSPVSHDNFF